MVLVHLVLPDVWDILEGPPESRRYEMCIRRDSTKDVPDMDVSIASDLFEYTSPNGVSDELNQYNLLRRLKL